MEEMSHRSDVVRIDLSSRATIKEPDTTTSNPPHQTKNNKRRKRRSKKKS